MATSKLAEPLRWTIVCGGLLAFTGVALGAFAAHGLKQSLDAYAIGVFETGVRYQVYHALALMLIGGLSAIASLDRRWLNLAAISLMAGVAIFSGSLYCLALTGVKWLGAITPIGGFAMLAGWAMLIFACARPSKQNTIEQNSVEEK